MLRLVVVAAAAVLLAACRPDAPKAIAQAPVLEQIGISTLAITTRQPLAQQFFNQGLRLAFAFDHPEALRAFREALRLDPDCAMCAWGVAYAAGPNINHPERPAAASAVQAAQRALALAAGVTPKEHALIEAMTVRLDAPAVQPGQARADEATPSCAIPPLPQDADPLDIAYVQAMARAAREFPDDDEVTLLYAEALMMLSPWTWWSRAGDVPGEGTLAAIDSLERVLARSPEHAGANHLLIHALEASNQPQRALAAAERLGALAPDAGHMVHMASHIFVRVGRYADAVRSNQAAIEADRRLEAQLRAQKFEPLAPVSHHHHFLWASAAMLGDAAVALEAARWLAEVAARPAQSFGAGGTNDYFLGLPWLAQVRFARWDEILAAPTPRWPAHASAYPRAIHHYARGMALARSGKAQLATAEFAALQSAAQEPRLKDLTLKGIDDLTALLALAAESLRGEIALVQRRYQPAIESLRRAVDLEDALESEEPPPWAVPARQALGMALLLTGDAIAAEQAFRADLERHPANGWALYGLAESLRRQQRSDEATATEARFKSAWGGAAARPDTRF